MKVYVGTSGWYYDWNQEKSLDWYLSNSKLNAIELNASYYRFPFPNQIKSWSRKTQAAKGELNWIIKVNRLITHIHKLNKNSYTTLRKFLNLFSPLNKYISIYLFQMPPSFHFTPENKKRLKNFVKKFLKLKEKIAFEFRHKTWFSSSALNFISKLKVTFVSVDAPDKTELPREIFATSDKIYVRMHGRTGWYSHNYNKKELSEIKKKIMKTARKNKVKEVYIFFNNNHNMLRNARKMLRIFR
jgi:uncharacterized protein YecE (DUF72 family)